MTTENLNVNVNETVNNNSNEKKVNKVSAKKAVAQSKANGRIIDDILNRFASGNNSLLKGVKGQSVDVYRKEIFANLFEAEKKRTRKKIRQMRDGFLQAILRCKDNVTLKKLCTEFFEFYKNVYVLNDFSVNSVCSARTDENTRQLCEKALQICKKTLNK